MTFQIHTVASVDVAFRVNVRCPGCKKNGSFERVMQFDMVSSRPLSESYSGSETLVFGQRRCPDPKCHTHIFFVAAQNVLIASYPAETIDFDSTNLPLSVSAALEEAVICHASRCYTAAAIMVRKTLEELCRDRGAAGNDLKARLKALGSKVVLPKELLDGLDDLRLLGNDAAHIESQTYSQIGMDEVETGLEFSKEVLKAVYQYSVLLERLRKLKKNEAKPTPA
jgi:hypothetical protein